MKPLRKLAVAAVVLSFSVPLLAQAATEQRQLTIDDLLGREPVSLVWDSIREGLAGKRVMVTGGGGSIGSELCRQIARLNPVELIVVDNSEYALYRIDHQLQTEFQDLIFYSVLGDICDSATVDARYASITRMDPDGTNREIVAHGVRNTVGFTWHPETGELWFTDNGRDMMGDDVPPCELNRVSEAGQHFGYPFCHGGTIPDPEYGDQRPCSDFVPPVQNLGAHVAPLGVKFYTGDMFPDRYRGQVLIAEHGSWNRTEKIGYDLVVVPFGADGRPGEMEVFASGWLVGGQEWGRPNDVLPLPDGSVLVSDDLAGAIYRITYTAP